MQELGHRLGKGNIARLAALDADIPQGPLGVEVSHSEVGHGLVLLVNGRTEYSDGWGGKIYV